VRVIAPPERGKANAEVEATIAEALGVPVDAVQVIRGHASPRKIVEIRGLTESEVHGRLSKT
jgi:uncharacterized protein